MLVFDRAHSKFLTLSDNSEYSLTSLSQFRGV